MILPTCYFFFFFFNDTATTEIYTLSLHDALPICRFTFRGRTVVERPAPRMAHAPHGHGWRLPWQITEQRDDRLTIAYARQPDPAPEGGSSHYRAWQNFVLAPHAFSVTMGTATRSAAAVPAGRGHH